MVMTTKMHLHLVWWEDIQSSCHCHCFDTFIFLEHLQVHSKYEHKVQSSIYPPQHIHSDFPKISTFPTRGVHLLQWMSLHLHITVPQSPQFTLGFTLGVEQSLYFDKCRTYIYHYSIIQSFTVQRGFFFLNF